MTQPSLLLSERYGERGIRLIKKNGVFSLKAKMIYVLLLALLSGMLTFQVVGTVIYTYIDQVYLSEEACAQREKGLLDSFATYVKENAVKSTDSESLKQWCQTQNDVYLTIYREDTSLYESDDSVGSLFEGSSDEEYTDAELLEGDFTFTVYPIHFSDGVYSVSIVDFSESSYYDLADYISWAAFLGVVLLIVLIYTSRITARISRLSRQVEKIEDGNLEAPLQGKGRDELSRLASSMDSMRDSLVEQLQSEKKAWQTNQELITSISHDLRNPLTSLIGYTELLNDDSTLQKEEQRKYLAICLDKAYQLKELTDELFGYFLVFGNANTRQNQEEMDAQILLEQLIGEQVARLRTEGFCMEEELLTHPCPLKLDVMLFKRMIDNLFSNIEKYADPRAVIQVWARQDHQCIRLHFENRVKVQKNPVESTKIGVKTCQKIAQLMGASFVCGEQNGQYATDIVMPANLAENG